jgi:hypothetical protein
LVEAAPSFIEEILNKPIGQGGLVGLAALEGDHPRSDLVREPGRDPTLQPRQGTRRWGILMGSVERQRLHGERQWAGVRIVPVAISQDVEAMLIDAGLLDEWDADDPSEVAAAVEKLLHLLVVLEQGRV